MTPARRIVDVINLSSSAWTLLRCRALDLRARGFDNRILCMDGPFVERLRAEGIPVHTVPLPRGLDPVRLVASCLAIARYLRRERIELVHTHCSIPGVVGRVAAWLARTPAVVHTVHGFHFHDDSRGPVASAYAAVERACARITDLLLMQNRADLERAGRLHIGRSSQRRFIGNGIDLSRFVPVPAPAGGGAGPAVLTCVARLEPVKNHALLLRAAAILRSRGVPFRLRLVGDGPLAAPLREACSDLGLGEHVEFLGYREDIPELLAGTDVAVLASRKEGMPRAVLEAMAMGLPVVGTRVTGTREAVEHQRTGLLVPSDDEAALAAALELLIADPLLRRRLGEAGRCAALAHFDERSVTEALARTYDELLRGRAAAGIREPAPSPAPERERPVGPVATSEPGAAAVRVGRGATFRFAAQVIGALINVAGMVLLGNALHASGYGEYVWYYALVPLVASLADGGVGIVVMREMARAPADAARWLGDGLLVRGAIGAAMLVAGLWAAGAAAGGEVALLLGIVLATALLDPSQDPALWSFRARERLDLEALLLVASQVVWLACIAVGVALRADLAWLLGAATVAFAVRSLLGAVLLRRVRFVPRVVPDLRRLGTLLRRGLPFGLAMLVVVIYGRVTLLLLRGLSAEQFIPTFQVAYLLTQSFGFVASAASVASLPTLARRARPDGAGFGSALRTLVRWELMIALPLSAGLALLARPLVAVLFHGAGFTPAAEAMRMLSLGVPVIFLNLTARYALPALERQDRYLRATLAGLATNVLLGVALIPRFGLAGAASAYLAAELAMFVVCRHALGAHLAWRDLAAAAARPLVAAAAMSAVMVVLGDAALPLRIGAGLAAYAAALLLAGGFTREEFDLLRRLAAGLVPARRLHSGEYGGSLPEAAGGPRPNTATAPAVGIHQGFHERTDHS